MAAQELSHEQVWDDSALLDSWHEAFEEYKKYHSLAAKGEKVKVDAEQQGEKLSNGDVVEATKLEPEVQASTVEKPSIEDRASTGAAPMNASTAPSAAPIITETLLNSVRDQDMKNLMMSWYYAGYYTGLYEGKQQGYASAMQQDG